MPDLQAKSHATVPLLRPMSGKEIATAVKQAVNQRGLDFFLRYEVEDFESSVRTGRFLVGQNSDNSCEQLRVSGSLEDPYLVSDAHYSEVFVEFFNWLPALPCDDADDESVNRALGAFMPRFKGHLRALSSVDEVTNVWPQVVEVCSICEFIVVRNPFGDPVCKEHGVHPLTKKVKVTLQSE